MYKKIINLTFQSVFDNKNILIKALSLSLAILILIKVLSTEFQNINILYLLPILLIINLHIAVTTHRILLLGKEYTSEWGIPKLSKREFAFFLNSVLIGLLCIPIFILGFIPVAGIIIAIILLCIVISRLSLVFPATAIDKEIGISESWNFTKQYKLLMFFSVILFPFIFSIIVGIVYNLVIGFLIGVISNKLYILYPVLDIFITVFIVSALSATYKIISEEHPEFFAKKKGEGDDQITIINNEKILSYDKNSICVDFEELKQQLNLQYNPLGFIDVIINKEDSWMLKNPKIQNAYILLSQNKDKEYKIETYNTEEFNLDFLEEN